MKGVDIRSIVLRPMMMIKQENGTSGIGLISFGARSTYTPTNVRIWLNSGAFSHFE